MMQKIKDKIHKTLRWSEQYTKTDMVYVAKGGFWSVLGQVVSSGTVFIFAIIVARYLPKEVYGEYKYIIGAVALLSSFSLTGLGTAVFQSVASGYDGALREGFWENIRWSALIFIGAFTLSAYYYTQNNLMLSFGFLIGGSLSPLLTSANLIAQFLNAKKDFKRTSIYIGIVETLLSSGSIIIAIFFTHNPFILAAVYFLSNTTVTLWIYRYIINIYKPDQSKTDSGMMTYAKHLSLMNVLSIVASKIDQVALFHFIGPAQLAVYSFAIAIPDQVNGPLKMLNTMLQARFINRSDKEISASLSYKIFWLFIASVGFITMYIGIAPYFYTFFFPNYTDSIFYSQIYAISLLSIVFAPTNSYLVAKKKIREQYIGNIGIAIFQIAATIIGIAKWGLLGLILARVVTRLANGLFNYALYGQSFPKNN